MQTVMIVDFCNNDDDDYSEDKAIGNWAKLITILSALVQLSSSIFFFCCLTPSTLVRLPPDAMIDLFFSQAAHGTEMPEETDRDESVNGSKI